MSSLSTYLFEYSAFTISSPLKKHQYNVFALQNIGHINICIIVTCMFIKKKSVTRLHAVQCLHNLLTRNATKLNSIDFTRLTVPERRIVLQYCF